MIQLSLRSKGKAKFSLMRLFLIPFFGENTPRPILFEVAIRQRFFYVYYFLDPSKEMTSTKKRYMICLKLIFPTAIFDLSFSQTRY